MSFVASSLNQEFQILISLICESIAEFRHYDVRKIAVSVSYSRGPTKNGVWAYVVPLRYIGGKKERRGRRRGFPGAYFYSSEHIELRHPEAVYLMTFLIPRFFRLSFTERIETIVHEIYHLHPEMRGDLRRFEAPHIHHGPTPAMYRRRVHELTQKALKEMPELSNHPLLQQGEAYFEKHCTTKYKIPSRVFKPDAYIQKVAQGLLWLLLLCLSLTALSSLAAERGKIVKASPIFADPSSASQKLGRVSEGDEIEWLRLSQSGQWTEVSNGKRRGWVPTNRLEKLGPGGPAPKAGSEDALLDEALGGDPAIAEVSKGAQNTAPGAAAKGAGDLAGNVAEAAPKTDVPVFNVAEDGAELENKDLEIYDKKFERTVVTKRGKFFEQPTKFAIRFGILEVGDEVRVLKKSKNQKWAMIRLKITGEEGWYPATWLSLQKEQHVGRLPPTTVELLMGYGTGGARVSFSGGLSYNFAPKGFENRPRDRFEVGVHGSYWFGEAYAIGLATASQTFLEFSVFGRYVGCLDSLVLCGGAELGLGYMQANVTSSGTSADTLAAVNFPKSFAGVAISTGLVGYFVVSPTIQVGLGFRTFLSSDTISTGFGDLAIRF